jgi:predicted phage-related endonuclease
VSLPTLADLPDCEPTGADSSDREAWLAARRHTLGASEVPVLFGLSAWREDGPQSLLELWLRKRGVIESEDAGEVAAWGLRLEQPILEAYGEHRAGPIVHNTATVRSRRLPRLSCTPDGLERVGRDVGLIQIKTTPFDTAWHDSVPDHVQVQLQAELLVTGAPFVTLVWLPLVARRLQWLRVAPVPTFHRELERRATIFWGYVHRGEMPPPDASVSAQRALAAALPDARPTPVLLEGDALTAADELERINAELDTLGTRKRLICNRVVAAAGERTRAVLPDGRYFTLPAVAPRENRCPHCEGLLARVGPSRPCTLRQPGKRPLPAAEGVARVDLSEREVLEPPGAA